MSGEQEQQEQVAVEVVTGDRWGDGITEERERELEARLGAWEAEAEHGDRKGPFAGIGLTGADVFFLAARALIGTTSKRGPIADLAVARATLIAAHDDLSLSASLSLSALCLQSADLRRACLERAYLGEVHLEGADLREAHLERAKLVDAYLERANLLDAHLEGADLGGAHLQRASFVAGYLEGSDLSSAQLERAVLVGAHVEHANLYGAHLERAFIVGTRLEGADLHWVHLEGADLREAHLEGKTYAPDDPDYLRIRRWVEDFPATLPPADLRGAVLDGATDLRDITLGDARQGAVRVADVRWGGANLAIVDWTPIQLGDERIACEWKTISFVPPDDLPSPQELDQQQRQHDQYRARERLDAFRAAVRANRQLATALRDQGMNEEADLFAYRAQVVQRQVFRQQGKRGRARLSWFLDRVAGHGYKPQRSIYIYVGVILAFMGLYLLAGNGLLTFGLPVSQFHDLPWWEALILSVSSFHGRGFFQPVNSLGDPVAIIASAEAIFGLFIEVSFIGAIRSLETVARRRGMRGIPTGVTTGGSLTGANSCPSW